MHYALVFSTSKTADTGLDISDQHGSAAAWLAPLAPLVTTFASTDGAKWLDHARAAEILFSADRPVNEAISNTSDFQRLRALADTHSIDVNIVATRGRRKQLLIADMDSTIITSESLDDLAAMAGIGDAVAAITKRSMAGEMDFEQALDARVAMLAGKSTSLFTQLVADAVLTDGAETLVRTMRSHGAHCYLVSGGFDFITEPIAALCGFNDHHANHMDNADGKITGTVQKPVLDRSAKADYLAHYCALLKIDMTAAATIGDGANDLAMLQAAGMGVAFHAKPLLREAVALQLNHTDLRGLLYLQGYAAAEFDHP